MRIKCASPASGQVLVTAVIITGVVGIALGAYLNLLTSNTSYTARSQS